MTAYPNLATATPRRRVAGAGRRRRAVRALLALLLSCVPLAGFAQAPSEDDGEAAAPSSSMPERFDVLDDALVATSEEGAVAWRLPLPDAGGPVGDPARGAEAGLWLPRGAYVLRIDATEGTVQERRAVPAPVEAIEETDPLRVTVRHEDGSLQTLRPPAPGEAIDEAVRFGTDPQAFGWLQAEARALARDADAVEAAITRDPTQPWLQVERADLLANAGDDEAAEDALSEAAALAEDLPFFENARLAGALDDRGAFDEAATSMDRALADMEVRGYDPRLLTDLELHAAYGLPLDRVQEALEAGDVAAAERWAPWLWRTAASTTPETVDALHGVADALAAEGEEDAAALWNDRATSLERGDLTGVMDASALALARFGWAGVAASVGGALLLYLTLWAKYLRPQRFFRQQRRERGEATRPWTRILAVRHFSTTEKVVLALMLVVAAMLAGLTGWGQRAADLPPAFRSGTLASFPAQEAVGDLRDGTVAQFVRGYAAQVVGDEDRAERHLMAAGDHAGALVNLAVLQGDDSLYQRALRTSPRHRVARYNLGRSSNPSPFHEAYGSDRPLLAVPSPTDLGMAAGGDWRGVLGSVATRPWVPLSDARPASVPTWAWSVAWLVFLLAVLASVAMILWPRPRASRNAPRSPAYHLLAVLLPGTGQADELYGVLLLAPWSLLGLDLIVRLSGGAPTLGLSLGLEIAALAAIYVVNWVTFFLEFTSYRHRMRKLRQDQPELARSLGLPPHRPTKSTEG